ncbi:MAG: PD-(D/E)XK nuclease family protein [Candidatus Paceibacterota bacterium]
MIEIDYSQLNTFINCPHKYRNKYLLGLAKIKIDERDTDKNFGKSVHKSLEILYKGGSLEQAKEIFRKEYQCVENEKVKTPLHGEKLTEEYWKYWNESTSDISDKCLTTAEVESVGDFIIGDKVKYIVKIDRIVRSNSGYWVIDHKTSTSLSYNYFWQFNPNMQISGYVDYATRKFGQCSGAIIDLLSLGFRQKKYKEFEAGFHCEFVREIINRNKEQIADFEKNVLMWTDRIVRSEMLNEFPKNEYYCHGYKSGCEYKELCVSCDDSALRDSLYEVVDNKSYLKEGE